MIQNLLEIEVSDRTPQNPEGTDPVGMSVYLNLAEAKRIQKQIEEFVESSKTPRVFVLFEKNDYDVIHPSENDPEDYSLSYLNCFLPLKLNTITKDYDTEDFYYMKTVDFQKNIKILTLKKISNKIFEDEIDPRIKFKLEREYFYVGKYYKELGIEEYQRFTKIVPLFDIDELEVVTIGPRPDQDE